MKVLAVETSGKSASVCVTEDEKKLFEVYSDCGLTHGKELVPTIEYVLSRCAIKPCDIDLFAVSGGPGSFTGIRIGISAVKALAWCTKKPCACVSSLEAAAHNAGSDFSGIICCMTDARGGRMYNAMFECADGKINRICEDRVILLDDLLLQIKNSEKTCFLVGDGAKMCYTVAEKENLKVTLASDNLLLPNAYGVSQSGIEMFAAGKAVMSEELLPSYLVRSQAERERAEKDLKGM